MSQTEKIPTVQFPVPGATPPSTASPRPACVVVIQGEGLGKRADLGEAPVVLGRSRDADLHIPHNSVSRWHCRIWRDGDSYLIRDMGATNQTRVNEAPVTHAELADGDHIRLGECVLKFISHASVEARYHHEVHQLAMRDALTGLFNRRHFVDCVDREIARAGKHGKPMALCLIDVDHFKPVNDRFGHVAGDGVLQQVAGILGQLVGSGHVAARIGGEEFAVMLPESGLDAARAFAEQLRQAVARHAFVLGGEERHLTISIGIAGLATGRDSCEALTQSADTALYRAKHEGRNRVCVET